MQNQTFTHGVSQVLRASTFTRAGYTFQGWATTSTGVVRYNDRQSISVTANLTLYAVWQRNAQPPLAIANLTLPDGTVGTTYGVTLFLYNRPPNETIQWSVSTGRLPDGLSLGPSTGQITGTPTLEGTFNFTIRAGSAERAFSLVVHPAQAPPAGTRPTIITDHLPNGTVGASYSTTLQASGATPITWSVVSGNLPAGLTLNASTGVISGIPENDNTHFITIRAENAWGSYNRAFTLTALHTIAPTSLPNGRVGIPYSQTVTTTNPRGPLTWFISQEHGSLPPGLSLNPTTGEISGTPTTAGTFSFGIGWSTPSGWSRFIKTIMISPA